MREPSVPSIASTGSDCINVATESACALIAFFVTLACTSIMRFASRRAKAELTVFFTEHTEA